MTKDDKTNWIKVLYQACGKNRKRVLYAIILSWVVLLCKTFTPLVGKQIFDTALPNENLRLVVFLGIIWIGILWVAVILTNRCNVTLTKIDSETLRNLKAMVLRAIMLKFWTDGNTNAKSGEQLSRVLSDTHMFISNSGVRSIIDAFTSWLCFVAATTVSIYLDWPMAVLCVIGASLSLLLQYRLPKRLKKSNQEVSIIRAQATSVVENILMAWRVIIRHRKIDHEVNMAEKEFQRLSTSEIAAQNKKYMAGLRIELLSNTLPIALIWVGAYRMLNGSITLGTLIAFFSYLWFINNSLSTGFWASVRILSGLGQAKDFMKILEESSKVKMLMPKVTEADYLKDIVFEDIVITAGKFKLEGKYIGLSRGKTYLLTGDSGVGKSVFLEFLAGIRRPERVRISRNGQNYFIEDFILEARSFGYIGKEETLLDRDVSENISYALSSPNSVPLGYYAEILKIQDMLSRSVGGLSAGEKQRVSFIRELSRKPEVFIIDEGLDSLDNNMKIKALDLIREVLPDSIFIICTHNWQNYTTYVNELFRISRGHIYPENILLENELKETNQIR